RKVLSRGGVDGHEVADAVLVGGFPGGDRRPDDGAEERLGADEPPVRALLPERREVRELALGHEEVDDLGVHAVEPEHEDARRGRGAERTSPPHWPRGSGGGTRHGDRVREAPRARSRVAARRAAARPRRRPSPPAPWPGAW